MTEPHSAIVAASAGSHEVSGSGPFVAVLAPPPQAPRTSETNAMAIPEAAFLAPDSPGRPSVGKFMSISLIVNCDSHDQ
jgi:hypothetical protein